MVTYQTAYLKANYPLEYMAALLSAQQDSQTDIIKYINDCKFRDIQILLPDVPGQNQVADFLDTIHVKGKQVICKTNDGGFDVSQLGHY